jgi:hypothetical protein
MRCFRGNVLVRTRPELHRDIDTGILGDEAVSGYQLNGMKGTTAFVEVVDMGPGAAGWGGRDMPDVVSGAVCLVDLGEVNKEIVVNSERLYMMSGADLIAEYRGPSAPPRPLMNRVLTERDAAAFRRAMYPGLDPYDGMQLPESVLRDGMPTDDMRVSALKFVYERVLDSGPGRVVPIGGGRNARMVYSPVPADIRGGLVMFSTVRSLKLRMGSRHFKLTPFSDIDIQLDELDGAA